MGIQQRTETTIVLTSMDVQHIVKEYLENQGYVVSGIYSKIKTEYDNGYDTHKFDGFRVVADVFDKIVPLK
jgi:hypothetical protein